MNTTTTGPVSAPIPTVRRLPQYLPVLEEQAGAGKTSISCTYLGQKLSLEPTQVRKDLEAIGAIGRAKVGYSVEELIGGIRDFLGWNNTSEAFLAGVGNLGTALLGYGKFTEQGLTIVAAFDSDPARVGKNVHRRPILSIEKLPSLARRMHVSIGIITVPATEAQGVANRMVEGGIRAIWNFAPAALTVADDVIVENASFSISLALLTRRLAQRSRRTSK